ncbi:MAG: adenylyl-sulfate kinase [Demequina sp.]
MSPDLSGTVAGAGARPELLVIGGRSGAGKSSIAHALHAMLVADDVRHAVIDGDALDLAWPRPWEHRLSIRNLAAMWDNYRELGYSRLIYVNTVAVIEADEIAAAMGGEPIVSGVLLRAADATVAQRLAGREEGDELEVHLERSAAMASRLEAEAGAWVRRVDTDGRTRGEVASRVREIIGW